MAKKQRKSRKFAYHKNETAVKERALRKSGNFPNLVNSPARMHKWEDGEYHIRVLPGMWEGADHFGLETAYNRKLGSDGHGDRYISRSYHGHDDDSVRDYVLELKSKGKKKQAAEIDINPRIFLYGIDRKNEALGVQVFDFTPKADTDLAKVSKNRRSGATLYIDDAEDGYDVFFTRGKNDAGFTVNSGFTLDLDGGPSPISDDDDEYEKILDFIEANPLPDVLNIVDDRELKAIVDGMRASSPSKRAEDDDTTPAPRTRSRARRPEPEPEPEKEPEIDDDDADLDEPAPKAGGLRKRSRRPAMPDPAPEDDEIPF